MTCEKDSQNSSLITNSVVDYTKPLIKNRSPNYCVDSTMAGPPPRRNPFGPGGSLTGTSDGRHGALRSSPMVYTRGDSIATGGASPVPSDSSSEGGRITVTIKELQGE